MATLQLMRPDEKTNTLAEIVVYIDGKQLGSLRNNEIKVFVVPGGKYRLKAKIDGQGSKVYRFSITDSENKAFVIATDSEANSPEPLISGTWLDFIVAPLQLLYYFIIGHNRHLTISELKVK